MPCATPAPNSARITGTLIPAGKVAPRRAVLAAASKSLCPAGSFESSATPGAYKAGPFLPRCARSGTPVPPGRPSGGLSGVGDPGTAQRLPSGSPRPAHSSRRPTMANLNVVVLTGRLTEDPELLAASDGAPVTILHLAVTRPKPAGGSK